MGAWHRRGANELQSRAIGARLEWRKLVTNRDRNQLFFAFCRRVNCEKAKQAKGFRFVTSFLAGMMSEARVLPGLSYFSSINTRVPFRRTFPTLLRGNGGNINVPQELMRHADIRTTMKLGSGAHRGDGSAGYGSCGPYLTLASLQVIQPKKSGGRYRIRTYDFHRVKM